MPKQEFSLRECVYIHNTSMKSRKSCSETWRKFRVKFPGGPVPNPSTIRRQAKRFKETGSVKNRKVNRRRHVLREDTLDEIGERLEHTPQKSVRKCIKNPCSFLHADLCNHNQQILTSPRDHLLGKWTEITEWVFGSNVSIMARLLASRQEKAASNSRLRPRVVFGWLCIIVFKDMVEGNSKRKSWKASWCTAATATACWKKKVEFQ